MSRKQRKQKAEEHLDMISNLSGNKLETLNKSINNTKIFGIKVGVPPPIYEQRYEDTEIRVDETTTINAVIANHSLNSPDEVMTVLNFASTKHPCGDWLKGGTSQEESLAHATTLYIPLVRTAKPMYDLNERDTKNGFYQDLMVYTPNVIVLRDDVGDLLETHFNVSIISVPAVNTCNVYEHAKKKHIGSRLMDTQIHKVMESRCSAILKVAAKYNTDVLILNAFGCGVFKNNPNDVAWIFKQLLERTFSRVFKKIIIAIDNDNVDVFRKTFE